MVAEKAEAMSGEEKITILGRNLQVTEPMRDHIVTRMKKLEEITPNVIEIKVNLEVQKNVHCAEIFYKFSHFDVITHASGKDMYEAIDIAGHRMRRKLRKWKTKIQDHHAKKLSEVEMAIHVLDRSRESLEEINDQIEEENFKEIESELKPPEIVKKKKKSVPSLTMQEAAMRMDLSHDHFMVYRSEEDQKIKVMYVRRDKTLGILEVE